MQKIEQSNKLTPRQILFLANYLSPNSPTFSVIKTSGIAAGFGENYSEKLATLNPYWIERARIMQRDAIVAKAEKNLSDVLNMDITDERFCGLVAKTSMFVLERLDRKRWARNAVEKDVERPSQPNVNIEEIISKVYGKN